MWINRKFFIKFSFLFFAQQFDIPFNVLQITTINIDTSFTHSFLFKRY